MATNVQVIIDLTGAGLGLEPDALEDLTSRLVDDIDELVEDSRLLRDSEIPEGGKPALAGFVLGMLKAEVKFQNIKGLLSFLGNSFYGKTLKLEYEENGVKYGLEYRNPEDLDTAINAIERLSKLKINVEKLNG